MKIGILTFYRVINFGANLQALSTYSFLEKKGYTPMMINYQSEESQVLLSKRLSEDKQAEAHIQFIEKYFSNETKLCSKPEEVFNELAKEKIDRVIIGSDAVIQHHPLLSRLHKGRRKPFFIDKVVPERMFPNLTWGIGFDNNIKLAMMSASCQNSRFHLFSNSIKEKMEKSLSRFSYISVRDSWTQQMLCSVTGNIYPITPDPVFAFNQNVSELIPSKDDILRKFKLPEKYVLVSLMNQSLSKSNLSKLNSLFKENNLHCVSLPMPTGHGFLHDFEYQIPEPLGPLDWYALLKYASAYIGSNMHPIVVCLHNAVPCYSIDNWGSTNFFNRRLKDGSSKVEDILNVFGLGNNHSFIENGECKTEAMDIFNAIMDFPKANIKEISKKMYSNYQLMMNDLIANLIK